jgi:NAD(P)H-hydrate epimerase
VAALPTLPLYATDGLRRIEARLVSVCGGYTLMGRAAEALDREIETRWPLAQRITIVCGPGNNGGDGYVLARRLKAKRREVRVHALDGVLPGVGDGARAAADWIAAGGGTTPVPERLAPADVVVDALFGIGLTRPLAGSAAAAVAAINRQSAPVLAVDVPSGLCPDRGRVLGSAVQATATVTMLAGKPGLLTGEGPALTGALKLAPLLVDGDPAPVDAPDLELIGPGWLPRWLPPRRRTAHKGDFGHVLLAGGDYGMAGAIRLAAEAAARAGAGLTSVWTRPEHAAALLSARPELMVAGSPAGPTFGELLARATALVVGPGLGRSDWARALLRPLLTAARPTVVDADALNLLAESPWVLSPDHVLTPHPGEAARLLGSSSAAVQADRISAARTLAQRFEAVVVLKGAGTLIAAPDRRPMLCDAANPGLASGGSGDVLAGLIGGLLAQGLPPFEAAVTGVRAHADAALRAAQAGERGMLAGDVLACLRGVLNPLPIPA